MLSEANNFRDVMLSEAGVPGNGRFCRCWGGGAKHPRELSLSAPLWVY
jgi:hypothetical protein